MSQSHTREFAKVEVTCTEPSKATISLAGNWLLKNRRPQSRPVEDRITSLEKLKTISFDTGRVEKWDTGLLIFLSNIFSTCEEKNIEVDSSGLPEGVRTLLNLSSSVPEHEPVPRETDSGNMLNRIGNSTLRSVDDSIEAMEFIGNVIQSLGKLITGRARFRLADLFLIVQQVGPNALPVVSLVSFLVGLILAYMGAAQLERVGAEIYIADLVAIGMVREIAALMTGIIMAGRTGAAFAAELGTMNVNEEIDALEILGIPIIDFLVLPRFLALVSMIPLLTMYSSLVGILAGMFISITVFNFSAFEYYQQTIRAMSLTHFWVGLVKGTSYGIVVALAGCLRGLQCGRSALAVGQATTSAVVTSIVYIVITASALTIVFYKLDI